MGVFSGSVLPSVRVLQLKVGVAFQLPEVERDAIVLAQFAV